MADGAVGQPVRWDRDRTLGSSGMISSGKGEECSTCDIPAAFGSDPLALCWDITNTQFGMSDETPSQLLKHYTPSSGGSDNLWSGDVAPHSFPIRGCWPR